MTTKVDEIAPDIYRLSTLVPDIGPDGFTFNQFLIDDEEPLLFHIGHRSMFPDIADAIGTVMSIDRLRWISFGHVESDECGGLNELPGRRPPRRSAVRRPRLHGLGDRDRRPSAPATGGW